MTNRIKFQVYDNANNMIVDTTTSHNLSNPTVAQIKSLLNPGTYTNIKSEFFLANGSTDLSENDIVTTYFVQYKINLN